MSVQNSLMKIDISDRQDVYLICNYDEHKKNLRITLLDHNECKAFSGSATDIDLISQAARIRMVFTDFISLTMKALTKNKPEKDKFLYSLEKNCEGFMFNWESIDEEETIISIGSVKVTEGDYRSMIKDAFCLISEEMANLKEQLTVRNENLCDLRKEMDSSNRLLTDVNNMKENLENELFSKFILVLNEKKRKIRDLQHKAPDTYLNDVNKKQSNAVKSRKIHHISDSSDEDMDIARPSTSKGNNSLLFFDDDEPQSLVSPSKKRSRNQCTVAKRHEAPANKSTTKQRIIESESEEELFKEL